MLISLFHWLPPNFTKSIWMVHAYFVHLPYFTFISFTLCVLVFCLWTSKREIKQYANTNIVEKTPKKWEKEKEKDEEEKWKKNGQQCGEVLFTRSPLFWIIILIHSPVLLIISHTFIDDIVDAFLMLKSCINLSSRWRAHYLITKNNKNNHNHFYCNDYNRSI